MFFAILFLILLFAILFFLFRSFKKDMDEGSPYRHNFYPSGAKYFLKPKPTNRQPVQNDMELKAIQAAMKTKQDMIKAYKEGLLADLDLLTEIDPQEFAKGYEKFTKRGLDVEKGGRETSISDAEMTSLSQNIVHEITKLQEKFKNNELDKGGFAEELINTTFNLRSTTAWLEILTELAENQRFNGVSRAVESDVLTKKLVLKAAHALHDAIEKKQAKQTEHHFHGKSGGRGI